MAIFDEVDVPANAQTIDQSDVPWIGPRPVSGPIEKIPGGQEYLDLVKQNRTSQRGFFEEATHWTAEDVPFGGAVQAPQLWKIADTARRVHAGQPASDTDLMGLNLYLQHQKREQAETTGGQVAKIIKGMISWGGEITAMTVGASLMGLGEGAVAGAAVPVAGETGVSELAGGAVGAVAGAVTGEAAAVAKKTAEAAGVTIAKKAIEKSVLALLEEGATGPAMKQAAWKIVAGGRSAAIKGLAYAAIDVPRTAENAAQLKLNNVLNGGDWSDQQAVLAGVLDSAIQFGTQFAGESVIKPVFGGIKGYVGGNINEYMASRGAKAAAILGDRPKAKALVAVGAALQSWSANNSAATAKGGFAWLKKAGWAGMAEQMLGVQPLMGFLEGLTGIRGDHAGIVNALQMALPDIKTLKSEALAFALPGMIYASKVHVFGEMNADIFAKHQEFLNVADPERAMPETRVKTTDEIEKGATAGAELFDDEIRRPSLFTIIFNRNFAKAGSIQKTIATLHTEVKWDALKTAWTEAEQKEPGSGKAAVKQKLMDFARTQWAEAPTEAERQKLMDRTAKVLTYPEGQVVQRAPKEGEAPLPHLPYLAAEDFLATTSAEGLRNQYKPDDFVADNHPEYLQKVRDLQKQLGIESEDKANGMYRTIRTMMESGAYPEGVFWVPRLFSPDGRAITGFYRGQKIFVANGANKGTLVHEAIQSKVMPEHGMVDSDPDLKAANDQLQAAFDEESKRDPKSKVAAYLKDMNETPEDRSERLIRYLVHGQLGQPSIRYSGIMAKVLLDPALAERLDKQIAAAVGPGVWEDFTQREKPEGEVTPEPTAFAADGTPLTVSVKDLENAATGGFELEPISVSPTGEVQLGFGWRDRLLRHIKRKHYENGVWDLPKMLNQTGMSKDEKQLVLAYAVKTGEKNLDKLVAGIEKEMLPKLKIEAHPRYTGTAVDPEDVNTHYESLSVNKGQGLYTENSIILPFAVPGQHGGFQHPNLAGWFRAREYPSYEKAGTLEVQEIQSELFQKNKGGFGVGSGEYRLGGRGPEFNEPEEVEIPVDPTKWTATETPQQAAFLNLMLKDQNWVPVFVQSILGHYKNKGFEKVRFPTGETAAKVEGHQVLADRLTALQEEKAALALRDRGSPVLREFWNKNQSSDREAEGEYSLSTLSFNEWAEDIDFDTLIASVDADIQQLKTQGVEKLAPIEAFYEKRIASIVDRLGAKPVTDANGNTWREVDLKQTGYESEPMPEPISPETVGARRKLTPEELLLRPDPTVVERLRMAPAPLAGDQLPRREAETAPVEPLYRVVKGKRVPEDLVAVIVNEKSMGSVAQEVDDQGNPVYLQGRGVDESTMPTVDLPSARQLERERQQDAWRKAHPRRSMSGVAPTQADIQIREKPTASWMGASVLGEVDTSPAGTEFVPTAEHLQKADALYAKQEAGEPLTAEDQSYLNQLERSIPGEFGSMRYSKRQSSLPIRVEKNITERTTMFDGGDIGDEAANDEIADAEGNEIVDTEIADQLQAPAMEEGTPVADRVLEKMNLPEYVNRLRLAHVLETGTVLDENRARELVAEKLRDRLDKMKRRREERSITRDYSKTIPPSDVVRAQRASESVAQAETKPSYIQDFPADQPVVGLTNLGTGLPGSRMTEAIAKKVNARGRQLHVNPTRLRRAKAVIEDVKGLKPDSNLLSGIRETMASEDRPDALVAVVDTAPESAEAATFLPTQQLVNWAQTGRFASEKINRIKEGNDWVWNLDPIYRNMSSLLTNRGDFGIWDRRADLSDETGPIIPVFTIHPDAFKDPELAGKLPTLIADWAKKNRVQNLGVAGMGHLKGEKIVDPPWKESFENIMTDALTKNMPERKAASRPPAAAKVPARMPTTPMVEKVAETPMKIVRTNEPYDVNPPKTMQRDIVERSANVYWGTGENKVLSNLAPRPFDYEGRHYESVEHAYQSLKSGTFDPNVYGADWSRGGKVRTGRPADTTNGNNIRLMEQLMRASFKQNIDARIALQKTDTARLTHTQDRGIWGTEFPRILTEIRGEGIVERPTETMRRGIPEAIPGVQEATVEGAMKDVEEAAKGLGIPKQELLDLHATESIKQLGETPQEFARRRFCEGTGTPLAKFNAAIRMRKK